MTNTPLKSQTFTCWTAATNSTILPTLREILEQSSDSLVLLLRDCSALGVDLVELMHRYVCAADDVNRSALRQKLTDTFSTVRNAAVEQHRWDWGKGPFLILDAEDNKMSGHRATVTSRCMTAELELALVNTKFPARPGEPNVPQLRVRVALNPHDSRQSELAARAVQKLRNLDAINLEQ